MDSSTHTGLDKNAELTELGREAGVLAAVEVGLGSILHGLQLPLAGHLLSLNQIFLLARATRRAAARGGNTRTAPFLISNVTAILKSLSPAGRKLTPMLAISAQGLLFTVGTLLFGARLPALMLGAALAGLWSLAQPVLLAWLLLGNTLVQLSEILYQRSREWFHFGREDLLIAISVLVSLKVTLSVLAALLARALPETAVNRYLDRMLAAGAGRARTRLAVPRPAVSLREHARGAARDLLNPLFFFSLGLTALFFIYAEASASQTLWALLRPFAVGFLLFFAARALPLARLPGPLGRATQSAAQTLERLTR